MTAGEAPLLEAALLVARVVRLVDMIDVFVRERDGRVRQELSFRNQSVSVQGNEGCEEEEENTQQLLSRRYLHRWGRHCRGTYYCGKAITIAS